MKEVLLCMAYIQISLEVCGHWLGRKIHYGTTYSTAWRDDNKSWKILKEMGNQTTWPASWETWMQVRKQLELDREQQTGSK